MKKTFRKILTVTMILSMTMPTVSFAADQKTQAYMAYYDYIRQELDAGYLLPSNDDSVGSLRYYYKQEGIIYAKLLDFDGDGIDELFTLKSVYDGDYWEKKGLGQYYPPMPEYNTKFYVHDYQNGALKTVVSSEFSGMFKHGFSKDANGKAYFWVAGEDLDSYSYCSIVNGKWTTIDLSFSGVPSWIEGVRVGNEYIYVKSPTIKSVDYYINHKKVSRNDYVAKEKFLKAKYSEEFYAGKIFPDWAVHGVKAELEKRLPAGYATTYNTPSTWAQAGVSQAINMMVVPSYLQGKYAQPITRQEFCALAVKYYETTTGNTITQRAYFTDTNDINVQKMGGMGIVGGVGGGKFDPNGTLTREAAASILVRLAEALGNPIAEAAPTFADNDKISSWAFSKVGQIQAAGIMGGTGGNNFSPKTAYTREQSIITVTKLNAFQPQVTGVELKEKNIDLRINETKTLTPIFEGSATANKLLTWTSSDAAVATVDKDGKVTAHKGGTATITATVTGGASTSCKVKVEKPIGPFYVDLPQKIKVYDKWGDGEYLGKVTIKDIEYVTHPQYNLELYEVHGIVSELEDDYFEANIGWKITDYNGKVIASDTEEIGGTSFYRYEEGSKFDFSIHHEIYGLKDNEYYNLEFYSVK